MSSAKQIPYQSELARKTVHLAALGIPIIYLNVNRGAGLMMLVAMAIVSICIDLLIHYHEPTRKVVLALVGPIMRTHELSRDRFLLTGASWVLISALATMAIFPKSVAVTAFTILIVSDTFAALVGRRFQGPAFLDKSLIGTITFVVTAWLVVLTYGWIYDMPWTYFACGVVGGVVGGIVEAASIRLKLDDNFSIPFSISVVMCFLGWLVVIANLPNYFGAIP